TEGRIKKDGKLLGATAGNIYSEYVLNGSEEITNLEKDNLLDIPRDAKVVSDKLINSSMLSNHYLEIINERNSKKLEVYTKTEEFQLLKKVGLVTLHTVSIVGDVAVMVGTGGISIPVGAITILDSVDEIDRIIRGCEGDDCKTTLNKIVGDKSYYFVKGTSTVIGVVQTAKLTKNVVKSLSKTDDAIKTLDKLDDGLKIVSKSDDTLNSISKTEKSIKVIDRTKPSNIGDILSVTKSDDVIIPKNRIKGSVVTEKGYKVSYDTKKIGTQIDDIIRNGDSTGKKTEKIINDIFKSTPDLEVLDGKYGSNNGIDHLVYNKKTKELWVIDSKQISNLKNYESGSMTLLEKGIDKTRQLSENWIKSVANKLPKKEKELLENNIDNIRTAVIGINKKNGEIIFVPLKVENKIK
uniref:hypothetical protein n=2 Tax=Streptobacillus felis TaxID=1384509 RepID=UPI000A95C023